MIYSCNVLNKLTYYDVRVLRVSCRARGEGVKRVTCEHMIRPFLTT